MVQLIRKIENEFDEMAEYLAFRHPCIAFFAMFVCIPVFALISVSVTTAVIMLVVEGLINLL